MILLTKIPSWWWDQRIQLHLFVNLFVNIFVNLFVDLFVKGNNVILIPYQYKRSVLFNKLTNIPWVLIDISQLVENIDKDVFKNSKNANKEGNQGLNVRRGIFWTRDQRTDRWFGWWQFSSFFLINAIWYKINDLPHSCNWCNRH